MKLNEQISFLRRERGITQEELARALGVSNQSVSKWESAQCCPDISLLPEIADYFGVSVDALMGHRGADTPDDLVLAIRTAVESAPCGADFALTLKLAYTLHAVLFSKHMADINTGWDADSIIKHAGSAEWGYSCYDLPEITTLQRRGTVFFSNNSDISLSNANIRATANLLKMLSDITNLKTLIMIYNLTVTSEDLYVTSAKIAEVSGLTKERVGSAVSSGIGELLSIKSINGEEHYRIEGMYMHLVPLIWMFSCVG